MRVRLVLRAKYLNSLGYWSNVALTDPLPGGFELASLRSAPPPAIGVEEGKEREKEEEREGVDLFDLLPDEVFEYFFLSFFLSLSHTPYTLSLCVFRGSFFDWDFYKPSKLTLSLSLLLSFSLSLLLSLSLFLFLYLSYSLSDLSHRQIVIAIFQYLSPRDVCDVERVCHRFRSLGVDDMVWSAQLTTKKGEGALAKAEEKKWWMSMKVSHFFSSRKEKS